MEIQYPNQKNPLLVNLYLRYGYDDFLQFLRENTETIIYTRLEEFYL